MAGQRYIEKFLSDEANAGAVDLRKFVAYFSSIYGLF